MNEEPPLLSVRNLHTHFFTETGVIRAVDGIDLDIHAGETVCIVGESGSGKTVTCESITRIFKSPPGKIVEGTITFDGTELTSLPDEELRSIRGNKISHVFQNPQDVLNPVYTVGWQIEEALRLHRELTDEERKQEVIQLLSTVGIPEAETRTDNYPHEFSGGMKQRIVIAIALACQPDLLIADEPTTALDVTIQSQILRLLNDLKDELGMTIIFVTHDLGVVAQIADRVIVLYAGKKMEEGDVYEIFEKPAHPYTRALLDCLPGRGKSLTAIPGRPPDPQAPPSGCRFHPRCKFAIDACKNGEQPRLEPREDSSQLVSCIYYSPGHDSSVLTQSENPDSISDDSEDAQA